MMRRVVRVLLLTALLSPVAAASATSDAIAFSSDGTTFGPTLVEPLFAADLGWVPGDVREATLVVRNTTDHPATLTMGRPVVNGSDRQLVEELDVSFVGPSTTDTLPAGAAVPVTVRVAYRPVATNMSQDQMGDLVLQATLTDLTEVASASATIDVAGTAASDLPATGSRLVGALLILALGSIGAGTALIVLRPARPTGSHRTEGRAHA